MPDPLGSLCLVLHGHLPYVLHHGVSPHGEAWLYEAAAETYLPLLDLIGAVALNGVRPALTVGLTPVLLEQLSHERFKAGFVTYLHGRMDRARRDAQEFDGAHRPDLAELARRWEQRHALALEHFERIGRDIPAEFAARRREGHVQLLTSNATHAYMPLLLHDESARAQMACGTATTEKRLGAGCRGMWLPECAYRPANDAWHPAVLYPDARPRAGVEQFIAGAGVTHFFVETHAVTIGQPLGVYEGGAFRSVSEAMLHWDRRRGWYSVLEPVGVASHPEPPSCYAFARHPRVSEQVWSGVVGYPGAAEYLEFHRKHGEGGLRYHRVTAHHVPAHEKHPYQPDAVPSKLHEQTQHFCGVVREALREHRDRTGREGVVVAPFDAELFGHWWFEGPQFLRDVIFTLAHDPSVRLVTAEEALERHPPDKVMRLEESSWGEQGNHSVWINDRTRWLWEMEYRAEHRMLKLLRELPWHADARVEAMLRRAGRELLLLQASDWPFVIHSGGAVDYGIQRFSTHYTRFDRLAHIARNLAHGVEPGALERVQVEEADLHDSIFAEIDLNWWA